MSTVVAEEALDLHDFYSTVHAGNDGFHFAASVPWRIQFRIADRYVKSP